MTKGGRNSHMTWSSAPSVCRQDYSCGLRAHRGVAESSFRLQMISTHSAQRQGGLLCKETLEVLHTSCDSSAPFESPRRCRGGGIQPLWKGWLARTLGEVLWPSLWSSEGPHQCSQGAGTVLPKSYGAVFRAQREGSIAARVPIPSWRSLMAQSLELKGNAARALMPSWRSLVAQSLGLKGRAAMQPGHWYHLGPKH